MNTNLLVARRRRELTQQALGKLAGVNQADICRIEKAGWIPPPEIQQKLAEALDVSVESIFGTRYQVAS